MVVMMEDEFQYLYLQQNHHAWRQGLGFSEMLRLRLMMGLPLEHQNQKKTDAHPSVHANSGVITFLADYPDRYFWIQLYFVPQTSVWGDKVPLYQEVLSVLVTYLIQGLNYEREKLMESSEGPS